MGLLYNHKCKRCGVKQKNSEMISKGLGWICKSCLREQNLEKRGKGK